MDRQLRSAAHRMNAQTGDAVVPLEEVTDLRLGWTRIAGMVPVVPNAVVVDIRDGYEHRFVVHGRQAWQREIIPAVGL